MSAKNPAADYTTEVMHLDTSGRGRYEQHSYVIQAFDRSGRLVGYMKLRVFQNVADVSYVEVAEDARRRGVAEAMYQRLYQWADEERLYVKHRGMTTEGAATVSALRERGVIPKRRKLANPPTEDELDEWERAYEVWEAAAAQAKADFIAQARARFTRDKIVSVESYGDEVRFTSSLHKATRSGAAYQITDFEGDDPIGHHEYDDLDAALQGLWELASPRTKGLPSMPNPHRNPSRYRYLGTDDEESSCACCGKQGLKRVAWLVELDEDGHEIGEACHYGTTCAAMLIQEGHKDPSKKKPTKSQAEKVLEAERKASFREAWERALEQPLPPMPEVYIAKSKYVDWDMVYVGDEQMRAAPSRQSFSYERDVQDAFAQARKDWVEARRREFARKIAIEMGLRMANPSGRLRRAGARISNP